MTDETGAAAPATELAQAAPAETELATPKIESIPNAEASPENTETPATETEQTPEEESSDEPKKLNRTQRLQRKAARLSTMVAEQAAELEKLRQTSSKSAADSEPKETDYNGDWTKYQADYAAWKATQNIRGVLEERDQREAATRLNERRQEANDEFQERAEQIKANVPDFDKTIEDFAKSGGKFAPHVIEELLESDKGPMLAYQIAKTPGLAAELNALSPRDTAREIGRLEAKVSLPQPKKQTQAPAPLTALKGGAAPTTDLARLAKSDDVSGYWAARKAQQKASA